MTKEQRLERFWRHHGQLFGRVKRTDMWNDFLEVMRAHDPARELPAVDLRSTQVAEFSPYLMGNSRGFNLAINLMENLEAPDAQAEPEAEFSEDPLP